MRRAAILVAAVLTGFFLASPADAKFPAFEVSVDRTSVTAGESVTITVQVSPEFIDVVEGRPDMRPPVALYRVHDLPASGPLDGSERVAATVTFRDEGSGIYSGKVSPPEAGRYAIVSMGIWDRDLVGYPSPIAITVAEGGRWPRWGWPTVVGGVAALLLLGSIPLSVTALRGRRTR